MYGFGGEPVWYGFGLGVRGTILTAPTTPTLGARLVAANSEYLSIADASQTGLDFGTGDFSVGVWFYADTTSANQGLISKKAAVADSSAGWSLRLNSSNVLQAHLADGMGVVGVGSDVVSGDTLYLGIATFDRDGNCGVSLNAGTAVTASIAARADSVSNAVDFYVGRVATTYFGGGLVCAFVANALLDATDRTALYNGGSPLLWAGVGATQRAKIVSYWNLNESSDGSGAVTRNDSVGSNHLTDNNTTPSSAFPFTG